MLSPYLRIRSNVLRSIRSFFYERNFLEVETPVRIATPALELHIDAEPSGEMYLRTSPELHMKRLLVGGAERIFQIGACFRRGEEGVHHSPEYTMLEWYRTDSDYMDVLVDAKGLIPYVLKETLGRSSFTFQGCNVETVPVWDCYKVADAFLEFAGWDPVACFDADRFDMDLVEKVEPSLPRERPVVLMDYPAELAALARCKDDNPSVAERWELYIGGMELANAFSELTDPIVQRDRFEQCARRRESMGKRVYPLDEAFMSALAEGMPRSGGVALGIDRLVMLIADAKSIDSVIAR